MNKFTIIRLASLELTDDDKDFKSYFRRFSTSVILIGLWLIGLMVVCWILDFETMLAKFSEDKRKEEILN